MSERSPGPVHLNYHHLHYFWAVAKDGNLTRTARRLRVSQSALSTQIRRLEEQLERRLFEREGRRLKLTEAGRIALSFADTIFAAGGELVSTLEEGRRRDHVLQIGAVATLSRNFQDSLITPLLEQRDVRVHMRSGSLDELLSRLAAHEVDLILSNRPVERDADRPFRCRRIARQEVSLVGRPRRTPFRFPEDLRGGVPMLLPSPDSDIRTAFDALCEPLDVEFRVLAEVDDMAMMRLLARDTDAVALLPSVVVRDELTGGAPGGVLRGPESLRELLRDGGRAAVPAPALALTPHARRGGAARGPLGRGGAPGARALAILPSARVERRGGDGEDDREGRSPSIDASGVFSKGGPHARPRARTRERPRPSAAGIRHEVR